ncbi:MAG: two-component system response regulator [Candidatus Firestonebacteria bacterium RIFOXYC2_FULL_39_67]|nr:MAG: two-component system response regulator [Candidatus Firestonebacteria bacterium RIFOXYD2_FULL_39_29]OGF56052.1 MAG: two-component system response regulator [Candidatus Firestonebacteria bacterium RIFOXYC2_FULL_39_67]OGF58008.1 MAG: two-component system response regulator [Candidatus Firestonebacteria bacterium RifOxyC12_full_39_7]
MSKILIVDDSSFMRLMLKDILRAKHEIADEGTNGQEAVEKYKKLKPDLVTIDMIMPVQNGIDAVKEIVKFDPGAKVIMVSAMGQELLVEEAMQSGAKAFIVKPFQGDKVLEVIDKVLKETK